MLADYAHAMGMRPVFSWSRPGRFGRRFYSELHTLETYPDGSMVWHGTEILWLGTKPLHPLDEVGREARMLVREGLADVLEWLGEPVITEPTSRQILDGIPSGNMVYFENAMKRATAA